MCTNGCFSGSKPNLLLQKNVDRLISAARAITVTLENGSLQRYAALLLLAAGAALVLPVVAGETALAGDLPLSVIDPVTLLGAGLIMAAGLATVLWRRQRLTALIALSVVGLLTVLTFVRFSAPDLALTQLAVEVVTIVLLLLALYFLPQQDRAESGPLRCGRDLLLALTIGGGTGLLTWAVLTRPYAGIADYFLENSLPGDGGSNAVNVILVDFRGFDTLGRSPCWPLPPSVFSPCSTTSAWRRAPCTESGRAEGRSDNPGPDPDQPLYPAAGPDGVDLSVPARPQRAGGRLYRRPDHRHRPDLQHMASGIAWTQQQWRQKYHTVIAWGLFIAIFTGSGSWPFNRPFLTSAFGHFQPPAIGAVELATAMLFDLGVYFTVVGVVMLILATLGKLSSRCLETEEGG